MNPHPFRKPHQPIYTLHLLSSLGVGGLERTLISLLKSSRKIPGIQYVVVVMNTTINSALQKELEELDIPVYYLNRPESHIHIKYLIKLHSIIRKHRITVLHAHDYGTNFWAALCKLTNPILKIVTTIHDTRIAPQLSRTMRILHRYLMDCNVCISRAVEAECHSSGITNTQVIYNGSEISRFALPRVTNPEPGSLRIINVARMIHPKKGQDLLLQALKQLKDRGRKFSCKLVGVVYPEAEESFQYLIHLRDALNLTHEVEFLTNRTDIPELLAESDLFILPSRFEGFGNVVIESMAASVPVIATAIDGPKEIICHRKNGLLFEKDNLDELCSLLNFCYDHPDVLEAIRLQAGNTARAFDVFNMAIHSFNLYKRLLGKPNELESPGRTDGDIHPLLPDIQQGH